MGLSNTEHAMMEKTNKQPVKWIKRIGIWGFLFFLIKGLIWLIIGISGYLLAK